MTTEAEQELSQAASMLAGALDRMRWTDEARVEAMSDDLHDLDFEDDPDREAVENDWPMADDNVILIDTESVVNHGLDNGLSLLAMPYHLKLAGRVLDAVSALDRERRESQLKEARHRAVLGMLASMTGLTETEREALKWAMGRDTDA